MALTYESARALLERNGQAHVLRFWDRLDEGQRQSLLGQIGELDFESIARMRKMLDQRGDEAIYGDIEPAPVIRPSAGDRAVARKAGEEALRQGKVGVIVVAGGQGSRLGFEGPKGCLPIAPVSNDSIFSIHARKILALSRRHGVRIPFYVMTSRVNDRATRDFFVANDYFGLSSRDVRFFIQGMWPALSAGGDILLEKPHRIFMSPDGHGGIVSALHANGMFYDMKERGLDMLFYFQVDNPLVEIADPVFLGIHQREGADVSVKVCAKRDAEEGLGVVATIGGKHRIVEYIELTDAQKRETGADGALRLLYGSVAIHVFSVAFLEREAQKGLPLHVAHKKVPFCNEEGATVKPDKPNAYKFEKFVFDVLPDAEKVAHLVFSREDEFSPVKNAEGVDSPASTRRDMVRKYARWMEECGVSVPRRTDGEPRFLIEIDPCFALDAEELKGQLPPHFAITEDTLLR